MKIKAKAEFVIVDEQGTRNVKGGEVVGVGERDGNHLVARGLAEPEFKAAVAAAPPQKP